MSTTIKRALAIFVFVSVTLVGMIVIAVVVVSTNRSPTPPVVESITLVPTVEVTPDPRVPTMQAQIEYIDQEIVDLEAQIADLEIRKTSLVGDKQSVEAEVTALETQITELTTRRDGLLAEQQQLDTAIASLETSNSGRRVILAQQQMAGATNNPAYFSDSFTDLNAKKILFKGLSQEYLFLQSGKGKLIEVGLTFEYCNMALRFEYEEDSGRVSLDYHRIGAANLGYGTDRVSDGAIFTVRGAYAITEDQISDEVLDQVTGLTRGFEERTRWFLLVDVNRNLIYCSQEGVFLSENFTEWKGYLPANKYSLSHPSWVATMNPTDLRE